jgi:hypothetical protein
VPRTAGRKPVPAGKRAAPGNLAPVPVSSLAARSPRQRYVITAALIGACTLVLVVILSAASVAPWDHGPAAPHTVSLPLSGRQRAPGWAGAANRYDIEAPAGVSDISFGAW